MKQLISLSSDSKQTSIWQLIARRLADEATEAEVEQLGVRLRDETELGQAVQALFTIWQKPEQHGSTDRNITLLVHRIKQRCISLDN